MSSENGRGDEPEFVIVNGRLERYIGEGGVVRIPDGVEYVSWIAFNHNTKVTEIIMPSSVRDIENFAFMGCSSLKSVTFSENLRRIGSRSFMDCVELENISLPDSLQVIDEYAFANCHNLKRCELSSNPRTIFYGAFVGCDRLERIIIPETTDFFQRGVGMFDECTRIALDVGNGRIVELSGDAIIFRPYILHMIKYHEESPILLEEIKGFVEKYFPYKGRYYWKKLLMEVDLEMLSKDLGTEIIMKRAIKYIKPVISLGNIHFLSILLNKTNVITNRNINCYLQYALKEQQSECYAKLFNYKQEKCQSRTPKVSFRI